MHVEGVIPREFLEQYLKLLSPDSFCTLLRFFFFYFDNKEKGNEISIPSTVFQKHILVSDDKDRVEYAWGELSYWDLVKRVYGQNSYELNIGKIFNNEDKFRVSLTDDGIKIRRKRNLADYLQKYIERIVSSFTNPRLSEKVSELISGHIKYLYGEKGRVELQDIKFLTDPFFDVPQIVLEKTCDVYITSYYAKKPVQYIHGIMKKIQEERSDKPTDKEDLKTLSLKQYKQEFEESNRQLAIKIASGKIQDNKAYQAYLRTKDIKGLNRLFEIGCKILIEENRSSDIKKDYDWIQQ
ncbi:MAG: hypothetical protein PHF86_04655 [Candidatus Nanoarchaeia archaeon]|jgi:hypothetical protein|nr:hypothetical protein [Candidatus Nanoarchaeia archaeon]